MENYICVHIQKDNGELFRVCTFYFIFISYHTTISSVRPVHRCEVQSNYLGFTASFLNTIHVYNQGKTRVVTS